MRLGAGPPAPDGHERQVQSRGRARSCPRRARCRRGSRPCRHARSRNPMARSVGPIGRREARGAPPRWPRCAAGPRRVDSPGDSSSTWRKPAAPEARAHAGRHEHGHAGPDQAQRAVVQVVPVGMRDEHRVDRLPVLRRDGRLRPHQRPDAHPQDRVGEHAQPGHLQQDGGVAQVRQADGAADRSCSPSIGQPATRYDRVMPAAAAPSWLEVGDRVFVRRYRFFDQAIGLVLGDGAALLIDTRTTPGACPRAAGRCPDADRPAHRGGRQHPRPLGPLLRQRVLRSGTDLGPAGSRALPGDDRRAPASAD